MIAIIDSGGANIASVKFALERLGVGSVLTDDVNVIRSANKVILPGVGVAPVAMHRLVSTGLIDCIRTLQQPVLGICLGMQLLFSRSAEGDTPLLGLLEATCRAFSPTSQRSVPHMGWNQLIFRQEHPLLAGVKNGAYVYFVHSYFAPVIAQTVAECSYGHNFTAIVGKKNFMGCQFHPERSGSVGARILQNFLEMP